MGIWQSMILDWRRYWSKFKNKFLKHNCNEKSIKLTGLIRFLLPRGNRTRLIWTDVLITRIKGYLCQTRHNTITVSQWRLPSTNFTASSLTQKLQLMEEINKEIPPFWWDLLFENGQGYNPQINNNLNFVPGIIVLKFQIDLSTRTKAFTWKPLFLQTYEKHFFCNCTKNKKRI